MLDRTKTMNLDEEERAMIPSTFKGLCQIYHLNMPILVELYKTKFSTFLKKEIESGTPVEVKPEKPS